jgi:hypothetical protein
MCAQFDTSWDVHVDLKLLSSPMTCPLWIFYYGTTFPPIFCGLFFNSSGFLGQERGYTVPAVQSLTAVRRMFEWL